MSKTKMTALTAAMFASSIASAAISDSSNPFSAQSLSSGYQQVDFGKHAEGKCGEGKCGGKKASDEGKCGEGKCGENKAKAAEGKCGEGKCGH